MNGFVTHDNNALSGHSSALQATGQATRFRPTELQHSRLSYKYNIT